MHWARSLAGLFASSLLLSATLVRADETPVAQASVGSGAAQDVAPAQDAKPVQDAEQQGSSLDDTTWFGMGFESRQDRFRREMGGPAGQHGGGTSGSRNGGGQGLGR